MPWSMLDDPAGLAGTPPSIAVRALAEPIRCMCSAPRQRGALRHPGSDLFNGTGAGRAYVSGGDGVEAGLLEAMLARGDLEPALWFGGGFRWRIGSQGSVTTLHQDVMSNTFVEVVGVQRFHLYPPEMWSEVRRRHGARPQRRGGARRGLRSGPPARARPHR